MQYGLIGEKLGHSFSPLIHGELGNRDYTLHAMPVDALDAFMRQKDFRGINVTIPYKKAVIPYLDTISGAAERIGSVNTIVKDENGKLHGYNTDYVGFMYMLRSAGIDPAGKKALVLGSGGTSLTARTALSDMGAGEILVVSRTGDVNYDNVYSHSDTEIIVNTTPVGMYPKNGQAPVDITRFPALCGVADAIYNPLKTALILEAQRLGIPCVSGLRMLTAQAKAAHELFFGVSVDDLLVEKICRGLYADKANVILIGMPGSGKTSVGKKAAELLNRPFIDADLALAEKTGMTAADIIKQHGEAHFRDIEAEVLSELGKEGGCVIATGGGAVLREENYASLKQNGRIYRLCRDIENLPTEGRPISQSTSLSELYEKRRPYYEKFADVTIENSGSIEDAARRITEDFYENTYY